MTLARLQSVARQRDQAVLDRCGHPLLLPPDLPGREEPKAVPARRAVTSDSSRSGGAWGAALPGRFTAP